MGHPLPSRRQWLTAIRSDPYLSRSAANLAEWVATHPVPDSAGEYECDQRAAGTRLRVDPRTVRRAVAALIESGYLVRLKRGGGHGHGRYRLAMPTPIY